MRDETRLISGWRFAEGFDESWTREEMPGAAVDLPHNAVDLPLSYFDETIYQRRFTYQLRLDWRAEWAGREVELRFDGAMADSAVWINGVEVARHRDGYTPFTARLTRHLRPGANLVTLRLDGSENPAIPPFGGQIDYLTYAGLYRDVWLRVLPMRHIRTVKIETPDPLAAVKSVRARLWLTDDAPARVTASLRDSSGAEIARAEIAQGREIAFEGLADITLWSPETPALYTLALNLPETGDALETRFGFRSAEFRADGFFLNGERRQLRGLNRHQSFPHIGYAMGRRAQEKDAEILRHALGCNLVRTSHYPQSRWFLDRCDEIGLMVFEEIPGWQHIGDAAWREASVENVRAMIERDWNHPSIILWGVRINESEDHHEFYARANALARELDPTRQTGGVRKHTGSELLEDVYTMNDFTLGAFEAPGANEARRPLMTPREITGLDRPVPLLITEYNGHMFPTKAGDPEPRQTEHVIRHLEVLDAAHADARIAGCIGWCMADYNTHADFGAGDRICHHGVMTMARQPKFAAFAYASQRDPAEGVVMAPVTWWARGERNIGGVLPLIVLTNCDEVEVEYDEAVKRLRPDRARFPHLPHPPCILDHTAFAPGELGRWGMRWDGGRVTGFLNGEKVAERRFVRDPLPTRLEILPDTAEIAAEQGEAMRVSLRALDQAGNPLPFLRDAVELQTDGPARVIGPDRVALEGGTCAVWLRLSGAQGEIVVTASSPRFAPQRVTIRVS